MTPKKLHRFLIDTIPADSVWMLTNTHIVHQVGSVLKMAVGESFIVFENEGPDVEVVIEKKDKKSITLRTIGTTELSVPPRTIIAAVSITKGSSFELAVQKLTEIGVSTIVPLLSERTVKQAIRIDRLQKISDEALEQSGGNRKVTIHEPITITECFKLFPFYSVVCDAYTSTTTTALPDTIVFYVGPEGGWSDGDTAEFGKHSVEHLKLGNTILRTETAAIIGAHTLLWHS
jgi:16S rRNA (uracil1498-N3)-methyltransferase